MSYMDNSNAARLVEVYSDMIMRISLMYLKQTCDAEDICQEVFLKLLTGNLEFLSYEHEKAWIIRTTINACKDRRKLAFYKHWSDPPEDERVAVAATPGEGNGRGLLNEIKKLPKWQRVAIYLYYYEEYQTKEIAEMTGRSVASVQKDLSRGRKALKELLSSMYDGTYGKGGALNEG